MESEVCRVSDLWGRKKGPRVAFLEDGKQRPRQMSSIQDSGRLGRIHMVAGDIFTQDLKGTERIDYQYRNLGFWEKMWQKTLHRAGVLAELEKFQ